MVQSTKYIHVEGTVQGVGYRATLRALAGKLGVTGWVRNLPDGSVETVIQGDAAIINQVHNWCKTGSSGTIVTNMHTKDLVEYVEDYKNFKIIY